MFAILRVDAAVPRGRKETRGLVGVCLELRSVRVTVDGIRIGGLIVGGKRCRGVVMLRYSMYCT